MIMVNMNGGPLTENVRKEVDLLERTIKILSIIEDEQPIGIQKISEMMDIPEHRVRYSLRMLQKENLIEPSPKGATLTEKYHKYMDELREFLQDISETALSLDEELSE